MNMRRQKWKPGDVVDISLGSNHHAFGRVLKKPLMAFYDLLTEEVPALETVITQPILFRVWVMNYAVTEGDWPIIGHVPLTAELEESPSFFKEDPLTGKLSIYYGGGHEKPATLEEIQGLERAAVWEPEHVVDRLRDHFAGRKNVWVESLKPRRSRRQH
jgi:hypothetical protein